MSQSPSPPRVSFLALAVLCEELDGIDQRIRVLGESTDQGAARAALADLRVAIERHVELEAGVLHPVLEREGFGVTELRLGHARIRRAAEALQDEQAMKPAGLEALRVVLKEHRAREEDVLSRARGRLGQEIEALGYELDEVRQRLRGSYGV